MEIGEPGIEMLKIEAGTAEIVMDEIVMAWVAMTEGVMAEVLKRRL